MFENPFTPIFGGKPQRFFAREEILERFDVAMIDPGGEYRALFLTGSRGCGKTALLEQLSRRAVRSGRRVVDVGPDDPVRLLMRGLQRHDEEAREVNPQVNISMLGTGGGASGISTAKTAHYDESDLQLVFLEACERAELGLFVSIDEVQKVSERELSAISGAFQMASRKGYDVMIALAGLPYAYENAIHYAGCTYLRRATHEELGLFSWEEVMTSFSESFDGIKGLDVRDEELRALSRASYGHPYVIQLLGYYAIAVVNAEVPDNRHVLTAEETERAIAMAIDAYERRALKPLIDEMTNQETAFVKAMSMALDDERIAHTSDVARYMDKEQRQISAARESLIKSGTIISVGRGELMFNVPYLAGYLQSGAAEDRNKQLVREWRL